MTVWSILMSEISETRLLRAGGRISLVSAGGKLKTLFIVVTLNKYNQSCQGKTTFSGPSIIEVLLVIFINLVK